MATYTLTDTGNPDTNGLWLCDIIEGTNTSGQNPGLAQVTYGDTIVLNAGVTYRVYRQKGVLLKDRGAGSTPILITSDGNLPDAGTRINPGTHGPELARIVGKTQAGWQAITAETGAHHWTLRGLDVTVENQDTSHNVWCISIGHDYEATTWEQQLTMTDFRIERCFIHDPQVTWDNLTPTLYGKCVYGVVAEADVTIQDCYFANFAFRSFWTHSGAQACCVENQRGPGPVLIENCYLECNYSPVWTGGYTKIYEQAEYTQTIQASPAPTLTSCTLDDASGAEVGDYIAFDQGIGQYYYYWNVGEITNKDGNTLTFIPKDNGYIFGSYPAIPPVLGNITVTGASSVTTDADPGDLSITGTTTFVLKVHNYANLSGATVTINGTTNLVEGTDWTAATSGYATAQSLRDAIDPLPSVAATHNPGRVRWQDGTPTGGLAYVEGTPPATTTTVRVTHATGLSAGMKIITEISASVHSAPQCRYLVTDVNGNDLTISFEKQGETMAVAPPLPGGKAIWSHNYRGPRNLTIRKCRLQNTALWADNPVASYRHEFKSVEGMTIEGCLFYNIPTWKPNWNQYDTTGITFYSVNQSGAAPWTKCSDIVVRNNWIIGLYRDSGAITFYGTDTHCITDGKSKNLLVTNNLFESHPTRTPNPGRLYRHGSSDEQPGWDTVEFSHNTIYDVYTHVGLWGQNPGRGFNVLKNNVVKHRPLVCFNVGPQVANCLGADLGMDLDYNLLVDDLQTYPDDEIWGSAPNNKTVTSWAAVKFQDLANRDYRLANDSPGKGAASDGKDMGCDMEQLRLAMNPDDWAFAGGYSVSGAPMFVGPPIPRPWLRR